MASDDADVRHPAANARRARSRMFGVPGTGRWTLLWILVAIVVWNGIYDILLTRGVKDYLLREALNQAGRGPAVNLAEELGIAVRYAAWMATLWASSILLTGLTTVKFVRRQG